MIVRLHAIFLFIAFSLFLLFARAQESEATTIPVNEWSLEKLSEYFEQTKDAKVVDINQAYQRAMNKGELMYALKFQLNLASVYYHRKEYQASLKNAYEALLLKEQPDFKDDEGIAPRIHFRIALALHSIGAYKEAIVQRKLQQSELYKQGLDHKGHILDHYIGNLFLELNQWDSARVYYQEYLKSSEEYLDEREIAFGKNNIGITYIEEGDYNAALREFEASYSYYVKDTTTKGLLMKATVLGNIGNTKYFLGKTDSALVLWEEVLGFCRKSQDSIYIAKALLEVAQLNLEINNFQKSLYYLREVDQVKQSNSQAWLKINLSFYKCFSDTYEAMKLYDKALLYNKKYIRLFESMYGGEEMEELYAAKSSFQNLKIKSQLHEEQMITRKQEEDIKLLEQKTALVRFRFLLITLLALLIVVVAIFLIYRLKRKNEIQRLSKELLEATNERQSQRLTETTLNLARKKEFAEDLKTRITQLEGIEAKDKSAIKLFVDNELQIDESFLEMEKLIDQLGDEFFIKLNN